jgi:hypothetical protein
MTSTPDIAKKRFWPVVGVIVGPILAGVPFILFMAALLRLQGEMATGEIPNPQHALMVSYTGLAMFVFVPLGAGALIFSVMRLAKLRRQTPPKLPPATPPAPGEPS